MLLKKPTDLLSRSFWAAFTAWEWLMGLCEASGSHDQYMFIKPRTEPHRKCILAEILTQCRTLTVLKLSVMKILELT